MGTSEDNEIWYLFEYNWQRGTLIGGGKKNYRVREWNGYERYISKDKCARRGELVCVVWEQWKGTNGRGGHRVERELYPQLRIPAENVAYQHGNGRVKEDVRPPNR